MSCEVNVAPAEDDPNPPFEIAYRPCGKPAVVDVHPFRGEAFTACADHAREAEANGCEVDWPEGARESSE